MGIIGSYPCEYYFLPVNPACSTTTSSTTSLITTSTTTTVPLDEGIGFGVLYNEYAILDSRKIIIGEEDGWRLAINSDWVSIMATLGGSSIAGGNLKQPGELIWNAPNVIGTSSGFNALPSGFRDNTGNFWNKGTNFIITRGVDNWNGLYSIENGSVNIVNWGGFGSNGGFPIRIVRDNLEVDGTIGQYIDNENTIIPTIVIGGMEWTTKNSETTHYSNGDAITNITDNTIWGITTEGAWCFYENDPLNK